MIEYQFRNKNILIYRKHCIYIEVEETGLNLSLRELQILFLNGQYSNKEIASIAHISNHTVQNTLYDLRQRHGGKSNIELMLLATEAGLNQLIMPIGLLGLSHSLKFGRKDLVKLNK